MRAENRNAHEQCVPYKRSNTKLFYVFLLVDEAASVLLRDETTIAGIVKLVFTFEIRVSTTPLKNAENACVKFKYKI